uniref:OTU domain-containing protein n=1 Tax=Prymnesium polylepis TaxID=72548 RepID=A0A6T8AMC3_9EUKA|mmetsp:Transcript_46078/g.128001  ORF Transcript_46078/g.128001 Transcript_46078/m.128001 type:complete len:275 (-) Transcript_46078:100-924(-)
MGCGASRVPPTITRVDSPELAQNMKGAGHLPLYVSTRKLDPGTFLSQRADATTEAQNHDSSSRRRASRVALPAVQPGATVPEEPRKRMSRFDTQDRKEMIKGIEAMSSNDSTELPPKGLDARLATLGLQMEIMEGDGNCQFRAAAFNLFGAQSHHAVVRQSAVAQMKKHSDFFGIYFEGPDEFKRYVREMSRSRTWGDELTLRAIVEAYGCEAHVITSEEANWYLAYSPETEEERDAAVAFCPKGHAMPRPRKQIFLSYISPIHYNAVCAQAAG